MKLIVKKNMLDPADPTRFYYSLDGVRFCCEPLSEQIFFMRLVFRMKYDGERQVPGVFFCDSAGKSSQNSLFMNHCPFCGKRVMVEGAEE